MPRDCRRIIAFIEIGQLDTQPWIMHRTPLPRLFEEFPSFTDPEWSAIRARRDSADRGNRAFVFFASRCAKEARS